MAEKKKFENTLKIMKFSLLLSGIKTKKTKWNYLLEIFVNSVLYYTNLLTLWWCTFGEFAWLIQSVNNDVSFVDMSLILPQITISVLGTIKSYSLYTNRGIVREIIDTLTTIHPDDKTREDYEDVDETLEDTEDKITNESVTMLSYLINLLIIISWSVIMMFCLAPLILMGFEYYTKGRTSTLYPYNEVVYWFDVFNTKLWPFVYLHQLLATAVVVMNLFGSEILFYVICAYVEMHFRILCHRFECLDMDSSRQLKRDLVQNVLKHHLLFHLVDQTELLFSKPVLYQIVSSTFLICLSAFNATVTEDIQTRGAFISFLILSLSQIFLLCFFGDKLMTSSTKVAEAIYNCPWYNLDVSTKKAVLIIIIRGSKPCKLTAYNFVNLNLTTFATILSRSWSFFALLKTMYN